MFHPIERIYSGFNNLTKKGFFFNTVYIKDLGRIRFVQLSTVCTLNIRTLLN